MADLSITASSVIAGTGATKVTGTAGETITAGMTVYLNASNKWMKASNQTATKANCGGIALNGASDGQPLVVQNGGDITVNAVLTTAATYTLSDTDGGIRLDSENGSADYKTILGVAKSTTSLAIKLNVSGVALA